MTPIQTILDTLCHIAQLRPEIQIDPALFRPTDVRPSYNTSRIHSHTGWQPAIPLRQTLADIYTDLAQ